MTPSPTEARKKNIRIAFLVACASVLQILESLIPNPFPGIRLGLANMITLVALVDLGFGAAVEIAVLRTVCSSFVLGTFFSPAFVISATAALGSTLTMGMLYLLSRGRGGLSLTGISVLGALTHNATQLSVVYLLFIHHTGIFLLLPWLGLSAVIMGWMTGTVASQVCRRLRTGPDPGAMPERFLPAPVKQADAPVTGGMVRPEIKILFALMLSLVIVLLQNVIVYLCLFGLLVGMMVWARLPLGAMVSGLGRVWAFLLLAFLMPALFGKSGDPWLSLGPLVITSQGLLTGSMYAARLVLFIMCTTWLTKVSSPEELTLGLKNLFRPLKKMGLPLERTADVIGLAYSFTPVFLEKARHYIRTHALGKPSAWRQLVPELAAMLAALYQQSEEAA